MTHLGDITRIKGDTIPVVDCVIFGSPCQNLSIAGNRTGLSGEQSGLFIEAIRVIKEMREHDKSNRGTNEPIRPRFMVWENVPGALSSNGGGDFRAVLEETAKIADETTTIPRPPKNKWTNAGCIMADGWSIAWRVFDAQFWGVPQRRRRIALVADFGGQCAPEVLFERESVSRDIEKSRETREGATRDFEDSFGATKCWPINTMIATRWNKLGDRTGLGIGEEGSSQYTLSTAHEHAVCVCNFHKSNDNETTKNNKKCWPISTMDAVNRKENHSLGVGNEGEPQYTLSANHSHAVCVCSSHKLDNDGTTTTTSCCPENICAIHQNASGEIREYPIMPSLTTNSNASGRNAPIICIAGNIIGRGDDAGGNGPGFQEDVSYTLTATDHHAVCCYNTNGDEKRVCCLYPDVSGTICASGAGTNRPAGQGNETDFCVVQPVICMAHSASHAEICEDLSPTLTCHHEQPLVSIETVVRRLTPLECERLQGYPDDWTNIGEYVDNRGRKHKCSDTARYKALGNSIALPSWAWLLNRLCRYLDTSPTMGSLFDGIGGFPLIWENLITGGKCLWASEIEPFCIAVTKEHFGEENDE